MWTNVFKIGGLQLVSWFQFLPYEQDSSSLPDKRAKSDERDPATLSVLSSHLQLQKEGFLSTWTNSFVGPWDPSQGIHNPDEKIKLWLFLPGCHSSVSESAHSAVSRLRVIGSGVWSAPGDSEEVALALSQSLRNRIERSLRVFYFVRFADVFTKCHPFSSSEKNFRRMQPTCEFVFAANEEAIFVHVVVSAKHIRALPGDDLKRALKYHSDGNNGEGLPVISAPNGLRGRLIGICPADLVKQVYLSKANGVTDFSALDMPIHFAQHSNSRTKDQSFYVEVAVGSSSLVSPIPSKNITHLSADEPHVNSHGKGEKGQGLSEGLSTLDRTLMYPVEAIVVPVLYKVFAKSSPKRFWLQNRVGAAFSHIWTLWDSSDPSLPIHSLGLESTALVDSMNEFSVESALKLQQRYNSSSNSNGSSLSSISSTSSGSENMTAVGSCDLEADADSVTCTQSGLSRNDQAENNSRKTSKRPRAGVKEVSDRAATFGTETVQETFKSEFSAAEANSSAAGTAENDGIGSYWDLADDDGDYGISIQSLLSEFGDFSDFFVNDNLCFGEPPGTAESHALLMASDVGDDDIPCTGVMDAQDQYLLPVGGLSSFETLTQIPLTKVEEPDHKYTNNIDSKSSALSSDEFYHLSKAEAMMTFAPEYAAVETSTNESSMSIFRNSYLPQSRKATSSLSSSGCYSYNATPPPPVDQSEEKGEVLARGRSSVLPSLYYTQVQRGSSWYDRGIVHIDRDQYSRKEGAPSSVSGITSSLSHVQGKKSEDMPEGGGFLLSPKTSLATDVECMMLQASMCRIRHTLLSSANQNFSGLTKLTGSRSELRRKDSIPVRIAGDIDDGALEKPIYAPVGVWRSVDAVKGTKPPNTMRVDGVLSAEESSAANVQAHPLELLLDALPFVVQQSTSFVDIALDSYDGEEPYSLLALQEQQRRGFSCGPSMAHAGCGGLLSASHSLDIAGVDLNDPLSAEVHASFVASFLQSDIKVALKNAFGTLEGPLLLTDWCKRSDSATGSDGFSVDSMSSEVRDSSSTTLRSESISPPQALSGSSSLLKDGAAVEGSSLELEQLNNNPRLRAAVSLIPFPAFLVGYQDDWLKTSSSCIELWEKGPLEPYALPKPITYYAICPDVALLSSAAIDFFLQLGTVYESCKLGTHSPYGSGAQADQAPGRSSSSSGLVLVDCPQSLKAAGSNNISSLTSVSDFFAALETAWDVPSFLKALASSLKNLKLASSSASSHKEIKVVYVVCPFPDPAAVLQTVAEASAALGAVYFSSDKERRSLLRAQVSKAMSGAAASDEAPASGVLSLSGFNLSKVVLQIVTVDSLLRVKPGNELAMLKEYAFTVYNKGRRIPRGGAASRDPPPLNVSSSWDGAAWQTLRPLEGSLPPQDDVRFLFEPLFILSETSSAEHGEDAAPDGGGAEAAEAPSLHCCYGWTEDWRWLVCIWTDSRGELLDSQVFPFGGISGRQDTKLLQCLFVQILHYGCHILSWSSDAGGSSLRPRDLVISRIGSFFELERQEWQRAIHMVGGNEVKKWAVQLRAGQGGGASSSSLQQDVAERGLPSSPSPLYSPHAKAGYLKGGASPQVGAKKPLFFQFVQSVTLVAVLLDHSLQLMLPAVDPPSSGYVEGFSPVKTVGAIPGAYIFVPSQSLHHLPTTPLQLPTTLTSSSPPLAHLFHSKGSSLPLTSAFVVSKAAAAAAAAEEWPSTLLVTLVDHYGNAAKPGRSSGPAADSASVVETVAAELHSLSWMTASPLHLRRRTPLPFHCDMLLRLRRLLHYADLELLSP